MYAHAASSSSHPGDDVVPESAVVPERRARFVDHPAPRAQNAHFLLLETDRQLRAACVSELVKQDVDRAAISACCDESEALRELVARRDEGPTVALLAWSLAEPEGASLLRSLRARGAYVVAMVPPDAWASAVDAAASGADDVVFKPCPPAALAMRALVAAEAARRARPSPWHRLRAALREALAHETGGEVVVRGREGTARILVSHGRIAWVHDDLERGSLRRQLLDLGVDLTVEELAGVVAECRRTREHFAAVIARWGLAERETVESAVRSIVDARLRAALALTDAAGLFLPLRQPEAAQMAFTTEELGVPRATVFPVGSGDSAPRTLAPAMDGAALVGVQELARVVNELSGCISSAVLHYGATAVLAGSGDSDDAGLGWTLGAALDQLPETGADVLACSGERCHVARRLPGVEGCFVYAVFDLTATTIALARMSLADAAQRAGVLWPR